MEPNNITHNHEGSIELSLAPKEYSGTATNYVPTAVKVASLEETFKTHNYSPIHWAGNYREGKNFKLAVGFCSDIDGTLPIENSIETLKLHNLNYALITTRRHKTNGPRYRIFTPFSQRLLTYSGYRNASDEINDLLCGSCDPQTFDGARQFFGSPEDAEYYSYWDGEDFDVSRFIGCDLSNVKYPQGDWDDSTELRTAKNEVILGKDISGHTPIYCPFHDDSSPSAFVEYAQTSGNWFIHCSSCNRTYWKTKTPPPMEDLCAHYWSHGKDVFEFGIAGDSFFMSSIGKEKYLMFVNAIEKEDKAKSFRYLIDNKHIQHIKVVNHVSDLAIDEARYEVDTEQGIITVHYPPVPINVKDNPFIEDYLEKTFGSYRDFIKQWLAVYCYTNYLDLPTLILKGGRGNGKNTFAEMVYSIFPSISQM
jgi:hypothetical protein